MLFKVPWRFNTFLSRHKMGHGCGCALPGSEQPRRRAGMPGLGPPEHVARPWSGPSHPLKAGHNFRSANPTCGCFPLNPAQIKDRLGRNGRPAILIWLAGQGFGSSAPPKPQEKNHGTSRSSGQALQELAQAEGPGKGTSRFGIAVLQTIARSRATSCLRTKLSLLQLPITRAWASRQSF